MADERFEDFASQVAFEAPDDLPLGLAFCSASSGVGARPGVATWATDCEQVQRPVGVPVPTAVEPVWDRNRPLRRCRLPDTPALAAGRGEVPVGVLRLAFEAAGALLREP